MSAQFGRWNLDGNPVDQHYLERVDAALSPYGPDGGSSFSDGNVAILYYAFNTTKESQEETQPHIYVSGAITWDGRLDNRNDLISELCGSVTADLTDVAIVAAAYERWGTNCFGKLVGDWALSIWNAEDRSLILAKDPVGVRPLYYAFDDKQVSWSTILDPLVRLAGKTFKLNEEYIAGWLSMFPAEHLTPCVGVHSVPSSSFVLLHGRQHAVKKYWDFDPNISIRYRNDTEYEEHFRSVFRTAVQRRLRSNSPVLAELSGGRDSSSIVCVADRVIARGEAECPRLDTISYYDDSEPNWNERPYFSKVEEKRGRTGWHVNVDTHNGAEAVQSLPAFPDDRVVPPSGNDGGHMSEQIGKCMASGENRIMLSGIGGDETMGGVPTPLPELQDLLAEARFWSLAHCLKIWALQRKQPWLHLLWEASRGFFPPALVGIPKYIRAAAWIHRRFVKRNWQAFAGYPSRTKLLGALPSYQDNVATLNALRRQLGCSPMPVAPLFEKRYPFLDRDLLEFIFAIPREQLVRPIQRRSLMRRALVDVVPQEILNRKNKAVVVRAPLVRVSSAWTSLTKLSQHLVSSALGIVDEECLCVAVQKAPRGEGIPVVLLLRTIFLEAWLRNLFHSGAINLESGLKLELTCQSSAQG